MNSIENTPDLLGECPVWSAEDRKLYWMDLIKPALHCFEPETGSMKSWDMKEYLGGLALRQKGGLVFGMQRRIAAFHPDTGQWEDLAFMDISDDAIRFNDAKCDSKGRLLIGNMKDPDIVADDREMNEKEKENAGGIFVLDTDLSVRILETGYTTPNGFTLSEDESLVYLADSHEKAIYAYTYDIAQGNLGVKRLFASFQGGDEAPDGSCLDSEGYLWTAMHGGWRIVRLGPDGSLADSVELPVQYPTSLAFGGKEGKTLFVTTASQSLDEDGLKKQPLAGRVLIIETDVKGSAVHTFQG